VNARDEKCVGDCEILPFVLPAPAFREVLRRITTFDENWKPVLGMVARLNGGVSRDSTIGSEA
jgi:hypothetical protein